MIKRTRLTLAALGLLFAAGRLDAATITYDFTGTVFNNSINPFGVTDQAGAAVTGACSGALETGGVAGTCASAA